LDEPTSGLLRACICVRWQFKNILKLYLQAECCSATVDIVIERSMVPVLTRVIVIVVEQEEEKL